MTHSSDEDVLGLGNKASGSKKRSPPSDSEDDKEREDRGFQLESPENKRPRTADEDEDDPNPEVFPDCDAQVGAPTPEQTTQLNQTRALIGGGTEYVVMDCSPYPNFHAGIGVFRDPPYIVLLRGMDALHTFPPHALPQEIADRVAEYAD